MTRFISWLLVLLLLGGFGVAVAHVLRLRAAAGKGMPAYSVYSEERNGLGPAARLLRRLGWEPVAVARPIHHTRHRGLLVVIEPHEPDLLLGADPGMSEENARVVVRWVEEGNAVLLCSRRSTALHHALGVGALTDRTREEPPPHKVTPEEAGRYTAGVRQLEVEGRDAVFADDGLPLWWQNDQQPGAVLLRRGRGRAIVVADPGLFTERHLHKGASNLHFLYNVASLHAQDGRVYFDEYHHGIRAGGGFWDYLRRHDQQWVLLPLAVVLVMAGWAVAVRVGPAVPTPPPLRADAVDYASAVARIYQRAGTRTRLARGLARSFLATLAKHLRLRRSALPAEVLAAWRSRAPDQAARRLQVLLRGTTELRQDDVSERQLLAWTQAFDAFQTEVGNAP